MCSFDYTAVARSGKVGPVNRFNHTSWMAVVTPTDRPKSVRNRCVIELFVELFVLSHYPFGISVGALAIVIGQIQISSFFPLTCPFMYRHGATLFTVLSRNRPMSVAYYDAHGATGDLFSSQTPGLP